MLGLSITGLPEHDAVVQTYERNACPPSKRIATMAEAARRGLRIFGMLCPLFPGLFSTRKKVRELLDTAAGWGVEAIWTEIPNPRGRAIQNCVARLQAAGYARYALAFNALRDEKARSQFGLWLTTTMQQECRALGLIEKLHVLNYRSSFTADVIQIINRDQAGVLWL
jgi:DNA repair photolyase